MIAILLLLGSVVLQVWNVAVRSPLEETVSRPAAAATSPVSPHALVHPYGVNTFLSQEVEPWKREKTVEMIAASGVGWIKEQFLWSEIEPTRDNHWDPKFQQNSWKKYDEIVDLAEQYGLRIIARLDHTPAWAQAGESDPHAPPDDVEDYGRFVEAFVERYKGRVQYIQIWNEPNLAREWGGEIDPAGYFELLREAYERAKSVDPNVVVLSAPLAMTNERSERAMPEWAYWDTLYQLGAGEYFDIMSATGYGLDQPPETAPARDTINLRRIELLRSIMDEHGDSDTAIWLTEYGWNASPQTIPQEQLSWSRVTDEEQAEWTARGIEWMNEHWEWFGAASVWYFRQVGSIPPDVPEYYFAMVDLEFTPRPVYLTVQRAATERRIALPGVYGPMESPIKHRGTWARFDDPDSEFNQSIFADEPDAQLSVTFSGTDLTLYPSRLKPPRGRAYIEVDGEPVESGDIQIDSDGRSYIDLSEFGSGDGIRVVSGFEDDRPQQENTAAITIAENSQLSVSKVTVEYQRSYVQFSLYSALSAICAVLAIAIFRR